MRDSGGTKANGDNSEGFLSLSIDPWEQDGSVCGVCVCVGVQWSTAPFYSFVCLW